MAAPTCRPCPRSLALPALCSPPAARELRPGLAPSLPWCEPVYRRAAPSIGHGMRVTCRHFNSVALAVTNPKSTLVRRPLSPHLYLVLCSEHRCFFFFS